MAHGEKSFTKGGNMRAVDMVTYLQWIADAWQNLSTELIVDSFKACGIGALDGSDDNKIACFKQNSSIPNGHIALQEARNHFKITELVEELDLMEDKNNGYESENDEIF